MAIAHFALARPAQVLHATLRGVHTEWLGHDSARLPLARGHAGVGDPNHGRVRSTAGEGPARAPYSSRCSPNMFARQHPGIQKFGLSLTGTFGTSLLTAKHKYSKLLANGMVRSFQAIRDQP